MGRGMPGLDPATLEHVARGETLPAMFVDLGVFDANTDHLVAVARDAGKTLRLASKSVRVPALMRRIVERGGPTVRGLMCFSAREAAFLADEGFDDLLVAYPQVQPADLEALHGLVAAGRTVSLMVDSPAHIDAVEATPGTVPLPVCIDLDVSYRPLGLHLGAQRSPVRDLGRFEAVLDRVMASDAVAFAGVMGYEAQVAGVPDRLPGHALNNALVRGMKRFSVPDAARKREAVARLLRDRGLSGLFNAGGTGSIRTSVAEPWVTEVTAGSGFLQSHLFDAYVENRNEAALAFALRVTRVPQPDIVTCQSGGFIASGETGPDKAPVPFWPPGVEPVSGEGYGEVQTPLKIPKGVTLEVGDAVLFRPAKAGEIAERFQEYLLVQDGAVVDRVPTYRGMGQCFH